MDFVTYLSINIKFPILILYLILFIFLVMFGVAGWVTGKNHARNHPPVDKMLALTGNRLALTEDASEA
jgi:hypothetical protein